MHEDRTFKMNQQKIDHYVILVSEHNIAEYQACLFLQPHHIHLIVTTRMQKSAQRLLTTLKNSQLNSQIHLFPENAYAPLSGELALEISQWLNHVFIPYSRQNWQDQHSVVFNMTGATKILSSMLLYAYPWRAIHYQPFLSQQAQLQIDQLYLDPQSKALSYQNTLKIDINADLLNMLTLYADSVKPHSKNPIFDHPASYAIALARFRAQNSTIDHPFQAITPVLQTLWFDEKNDAVNVFKTWQEFLQHKPNIALADIKHQCAQLYQLLDAEKHQLNISEDGIILPTNKANKLKNWRKWVCGDWFEQLVYTWLIELGIAPERIRTGIQISSEQASGHETDILLLKNNQLYFLELKSDIPSNKGLQEFQGQLLAQSDQLGKVNKVLVLSSIIKDQKSKAQILEFEKSCQAKMIRVIWLQNKENLQCLL